MGPSCVVSNAGSPTTNRRVEATNRSTNASYTGRSTNIRLRAQQSWPVLAKTLIGDVSAALSQSPSAKTMFGLLPPSSNDTRVRLPAARRMMWRPTSVDPVNDTFRTLGCVTNASPTTEPLPGKTCRAPGGKPASVASSAMRSAVNGDRLAGFNTTTFPAANAGAAFHAAIGSGKFQGTIAATTPIGCRNVKSKPPRATGNVCPPNCETAPA